MMLWRVWWERWAQWYEWFILVDEHVEFKCKMKEWEEWREWEEWDNEDEGENKDKSEDIKKKWWFKTVEAEHNDVKWVRWGDDDVKVRY